MDIDKVVYLLREGKLVIVPHDTVYGIIGDASSENVIRSIYEVKHRDYRKPLIMLVSSVDMLKEYVLELNEIEKDLINCYWPGKLTIILKKSNKVSNLITSGSDCVGVRFPDNQDLLKIIEMLNKPVISTSANLSNQDTITNVEMLDQDIVDKVSYIYDGGEIKRASSTIVRVINNKIEILRDGELGKDIRNRYKGIIV